MSWLEHLLSGRTPPRAIEIEAVRVRVEADSSNDHEQRAVELLEKADGMVYSNSFDRATTVAFCGVGYAVLAVAREIRGLREDTNR
jgi:hypothetical protein